MVPTDFFVHLDMMHMCTMYSLCQSVARRSMFLILQVALESHFGTPIYANHKISNFSLGLTCVQTLVSFGARSGGQKARCFGRKIKNGIIIIIWAITIGLRAGQRSGPNNLDKYNRASRWSALGP